MTIHMLTEPTDKLHCKKTKELLKRKKNKQEPIPLEQKTTTTNQSMTVPN